MQELVNLSASEWKAWLQRHHERDESVWLHLHKKHTGKGRMSYEEAVEQALCFGWIDGTLKRIDAQTHKIRFTPRRKGSVWADSNIRRVRRLMREGRMTSRGLAVIDARTLNRRLAAPGRTRRRFPLTGEMRTRLMAHPKAWAAYRTLAPSHREQYAHWLASAKREETNARRLARAVEMLEKGVQRGMLW